MTNHVWTHSAHKATVHGSGIPAPSRNEVTDIIPFDEFGDLDDAGFNDSNYSDSLDRELALLDAPELDDLHEIDDLTAVPLAFRAAPVDAHRAGDYAVASRRGHHRKPANNVVRSRILVAAMAAGAASAAAHAAITASHHESPAAVLAADVTPLSAADTEAPQDMQMVAIRPVANIAVHDKEFANGVAFAQERAEREARLQRPLFAQPTKGVFTSGFGYRWGALHGGIDVANAIGTPILAVTDGVVIEAGPAAGYGMLVKLRHADGTVTLYGHVNTTTVSVGQRVMAGDQIATLGNRGDSTGPHLHFEVLLNGSSRTDPVPWLAKRGIHMGA